MSIVANRKFNRIHGRHIRLFRTDIKRPTLETVHFLRYFSTLTFHEVDRRYASYYATM